MCLIGDSGGWRRAPASARLPGCSTCSPIWKKPLETRFSGTDSFEGSVDFSARPLRGDSLAEADHLRPLEDPRDDAEAVAPHELFAREPRGDPRRAVLGVALQEDVAPASEVVEEVTRTPPRSTFR
jgi:hypothetical protein